MPLPYVVPIGSTTGTLPVSRFFLTAFPLDWYAEVLANGPLPVVCFQHGGNSMASDFLFTLFDIEGWWTGTYGPTPLKAVAVAIQGVSLSGDDGGGTWNGGNTGAINRLAGVDDVTHFFSRLAQLEADFIAHYTNDIQPITGGAAITQVFDKTRLLCVAFSAGGQFTYRVMAEAAANGWACKAACIFGSSIGGWMRQTDMAAAPATPQILWLPTVPGSLLHVHGLNDRRFKHSVDGVSLDTNDLCVAQGVSTSLFGRADISGANSAAQYVTLANAQAGWGLLGAGGNPTQIPPTIGGVATVFTTENYDTTGGAVADLQVCFALVNIAHVVPSWAPRAVVEFLTRWGGL